MPTILHVEDSAVLAVLTKGVLERAGYTVLQFEDGLAAAEAFTAMHKSNDPPNAVLTDFHYKGGGALGLIGHIRGTVNSQVPIGIVSTAPQDVEAARQSNLDLLRGIPFLQKEYTPAQIRNFVSQLLSPGPTGPSAEAPNLPSGFGSGGGGRAVRGPEVR